MPVPIYYLFKVDELFKTIIQVQEFLLSLMIKKKVSLYKSCNLTVMSVFPQISHNGTDFIGIP